MKRRSFVKASILGTSLGSMTSLAANAIENEKQKKVKREYYELRTYLLKNAAQQSKVENYLEKAAIPALNRIGSKNIGVFTELKPEAQTRIFVLIPYASLEDFMQAGNRLLEDKAYLEAGASYLNTYNADPAYERIESSLLYAFEHMPVLEVSAAKPRIFELRRYESPSEQAGKKKIEMFNEAGEIDIFKRTGLKPVFFGETVVGTFRPNLTYMLQFDDMAGHDKNWKTFGSDPEWKKISAMPEYADAKIISRITSTFLVPTTYSQI